MSEEVSNPMRAPRDFSVWQLVIAAFIGTPLAASFLLRNNISSRYGRRKAWISFAFFCAVFVLVAAFNPIQSRVLDTFLFIIYSVSILFANYKINSERGFGTKSWIDVILISLAFLSGWMLIIFVVFS